MSTALVPLPSDPSALDAYADPGKFVELACERAKEWLAQALDQGDIDGIVELKSQAEAIRTYTAQKQLGKDAELSAAEIVRRAERGIGLAIRKGQEEGRIRPTLHSDGGPGKANRGGETTPTSPTEFLPEPQERRDTYAVTDGVSDEQFDEAIEEAKEEDNLSRATEDAAREDAEELATEIGADWDDVTQDVDLMVARDATPPNTYIWSGGPDGQWRLA